MPKCPLCTIPDREDPIYEDELVYLIPTKNMKGHIHRVMCVVKRHTSEPDFEELTRVYGVIIQYMNRVMKDKQWFLVADTFATIKGHKHFIGCDEKGTLEELKLLEKTPKVEFPLILLNGESEYEGP